jgi:hypothetical protein
MQKTEKLIILSLVNKKMSTCIIGIYGYIGSGKDTIADYLVKKHGFKKFAFADALKDVVSAIYGWDREQLNGSTPESRSWRETHDPSRGLSPRQALQQIGTDLFRNKYNTNVWINAMKYRLQNHAGEKIIITDCRFPNEIQLVRDLGGTVVKVIRSIPEWESLAQKAIQNDLDAQLELKHLGVHASEWMQAGFNNDTTILNFGTIQDLYHLIDTVAEFASIK